MEFERSFTRQIIYWYW